MPPKASKKNVANAPVAEPVAAPAKYQKMDHREHVLARPGMYIGSVEEDVYNTWVVDLATDGRNDTPHRLTKRDVKVVPGLYKIFDEILVNAVDHATRLKQRDEDPNGEHKVHHVKHIKIDIDRATGRITVWNNGEGIEVAMHPEEHVYYPELIFGHMLTSSNYDDTEEKIIGGQNGLGAKCSNIFSKEFTIETVDAVHKKIYTQTFRNNMSEIEKPVIKSCSKIPYTQVSFTPDYERFKMPNGLTDDMYALMLKRCYDACAVTDNDVTITVNGKKLDYKSFERYADLYLGPKADYPRFYETVNDRWEVIASSIHADAPIGFDQVSFVNGIWTIRGGKHVDYIQNQIITKLCEMANKRRKGLDLKPQHVKNFMLLFVKSTITNPTFDSQTKDLLTTPVSKFGSKAEISDKFIEKLYKSDILERAVQLCTMNDTKQAAKTDGKKKSTLRGIDKLDDANLAGTARSHECTLILTEGDSAKSMAIAGMAVTGRDLWGVFPLKGKLLNVQDISVKKLSENEEITNLKKILGLETGKVYKDIKELRYGRIMVMCDSDVDGSHIKGLLFNLFYTLWPSLFELEGFLTSMLTPVIKARKGNQCLSFYNISEYKKWLDTMEGNGWNIKYYKGLGTSTAAEAREYFKEMKQITYTSGETEDGKSSIDLAFNKKRADDRKQWLGGYSRHNILDYTETQVSYNDFVNKELIHFSNYDIERSIPNICDGLKTSQRKIMYCMFKRNITKEMRVSQLSGAVSECSAYHHGEASLQGAIINMAQDYVGSININLLVPAGQFGTRRQGGKDSASPRYIQTYLSDIALQLYRKDDLGILNYLDDDGFPVEPEWYIPIMPMILINGAVGIGTGFSTRVPTFNPAEIREYLMLRLMQTGDGLVDADSYTSMELHPWIRGFKGRIVNNGGGKYTAYGVFERKSNTEVRITELPVGYWTEDFKIHLEKLVDSRADIRNYESNYTDTQVDFTIQFATKVALDDALVVPEGQACTKLEMDLGLTNSMPLSTTNMYLFNRHGQITKYANVHEILNEFFEVRLDMYQKRKDAQLSDLRKQLLFLDAKVAFIRLIINKELDMTKLTRAQIIELLANGPFPQSNTTTPLPMQNDSFDYLLRMPLYSITPEKVKELEEEHKKCTDAIATLTDTSITDIWLRELDELDLEPYLTGVKVENDVLANEGTTMGTKGSKAKKAATKKPAAKK